MFVVSNEVYSKSKIKVRTMLEKMDLLKEIACDEDIEDLRKIDKKEKKDLTQQDADIVTEIVERIQWNENVRLNASYLNTIVQWNDKMFKDIHLSEEQVQKCKNLKEMYSKTGFGVGFVKKQDREFVDQISLSKAIVLRKSNKIVKERQQRTKLLLRKRERSKNKENIFTEEQQAISSILNDKYFSDPKNVFDEEGEVASIINDKPLLDPKKLFSAKHY